MAAQRNCEGGHHGRDVHDTTGLKALVDGQATSERKRLHLVPGPGPRRLLELLKLTGWEYQFNLVDE